MTRCSRKLCVFDGTHHPVLLLRPKDHPSYAGPPMEVELAMVVCPAHQREAKPADFISDEGWAQLVAACRAAGRADPDRETAGLVWKRPPPKPDRWATI